MLAGRKLLLADDSITIQKVVDLTFADEGVSVLCVSNGSEAIERVEEFSPDVVLADVFMPGKTGYEVCEYIKHNDKLKTIPVMLLVGSFEPFDEAEARRVGADDTLTKPFQSIRRLIDKVGQLVGNRPPEEQIPTAELPHVDVSEPEPEQLSEKEIEVTTADTQPLPAEFVMPATKSEAPASNAPPSSRESKVDEAVMETKRPAHVSQNLEGAGELLLDLGEYPSARATEDFMLDIDLADIHDAAPVASAFPMHAFTARNKYQPRTSEPSVLPGRHYAPDLPLTSDQHAQTQEFPKALAEAPVERSAETVFVPPAEEAKAEMSPAAVAGNVSAEQLSPEMIDAIAKRAVEHLSEKVIQEIAWEVVPPLAELLIKRQLEEKNS